MIVVRKNISREKGEHRLFDEIRYFFYITNELDKEAHELVLAPFGANGRCQQENIIQQLKGGVCALKAPLDTLLSNWAYMVMTSLGWNLKAWAALSLPETGRWAESYRADKLWLLGLEFKAFINVMVAIPCQIVRQAGRLVYRVLSYQSHRSIFFRLTTCCVVDATKPKSESGCSDPPRPFKPMRRKRERSMPTPAENHRPAASGPAAARPASPPRSRRNHSQPTLVWV